MLGHFKMFPFLILLIQRKAGLSPTIKNEVTLHFYSMYLLFTFRWGVDALFCHFTPHHRALSIHSHYSISPPFSYHASYTLVLASDGLPRSLSTFTRSSSQIQAMRRECVSYMAASSFFVCWIVLWSIPTLCSSCFDFVLNCLIRILSRNANLNS